ncbi:hypothetical protein Tco_1457940 [Tanacetum coccineum]
MLITMSPKNIQPSAGSIIRLMRSIGQDLQWMGLVDWDEEVIVNGDSVIPVASASVGAEGPIPPKTAKQKLAKKNELKAKSTLMLAIPDKHLLKFHACKDAKSLWEAIKNRFGGNKESKKMQKTILKQNYENLAASSQEGLDKTYDSLEQYCLNHENPISVLDTFKVWMICTKFEKILSSTNKAVNTAYDVSTVSSKGQASSSTYADDVIRVVAVETPANVLVVTDGMGYDWNYQAEEGPTYFALMAHTSSGSSSSSSSDTEREVLNKANLEIIGYQIGLESLEARIVVMEKTEAVYGRKSFKDQRSKNLAKLINSQISAKDKTGLGYDGQMNESELNNIQMNESELVHSLVTPSAISFKDCESDSDDDCVIRSSADQSKPKYTKINFFKSGENVKFVNKENTHRQAEYLKKSQSPRSNRRNLNGMMTQKLENGFEFIKKACLVLWEFSFNHLITEL